MYNIVQTFMNHGLLDLEDQSPGEGLERRHPRTARHFLSCEAVPTLATVMNCYLMEFRPGFAPALQE